jgi:hypothetical protein
MMAAPQIGEVKWAARLELSAGQASDLLRSSKLLLFPSLIAHGLGRGTSRQDGRRNWTEYAEARLFLSDLVERTSGAGDRTHLPGPTGSI